LIEWYVTNTIQDLSMSAFSLVSKTIWRIRLHGQATKTIQRLGLQTLVSRLLATKLGLHYTFEKKNWDCHIQITTKKNEIVRPVEFKDYSPPLQFKSIHVIKAIFPLTCLGWHCWWRVDRIHIHSVRVDRARGPTILRHVTSGCIYKRNPTCYRNVTGDILDPMVSNLNFGLSVKVLSNISTC